MRLLRNDPAGFLLALIGAVFLLKYGLRLHPAVGFVSVATYPLFWILRPRMPKLGAWAWWVGGALLVCFWMVAWLRIPLDSVQVDRWDAIVRWWDSVFQGTYPYATRTRFGGFLSPLPVYQMLYLPGYLLGDIGWVTLLGLLAFLYMLRKHYPDRALDAMVWSVGYVPLLWEIAVRSTLVLNAIITLGFTLLVIHRPHHRGLGLFAGLLLAMRLNVVAPFLLLGGVVWRRGPRQAMGQLTLAVAVFLLCLAPLVLGFGWSAFASANPILHQGSHTPTILMAFVMVGAVLWGYFQYANSNRILAGVSAVMLSFGVLHLASGIWRVGLHQVVYENGADVSYLLFAWPFLLVQTLRTSRPA
jgi:hypothetical protein